MLALPRPDRAARRRPGGAARLGVRERPALAAPGTTVAVVIPALNEERSLPQVLAGLRQPGVTERVVVDNGSTDGTAAVARAAGATVVFEPRRGYGAACLAGLAHLREHPPEVVAFIDADASDDPADLPDVLAPILEGRADLVVGSRVRGEPAPGSLTVPQVLGNRLAVALLAFLFGVRYTDLGPFRAIRWAALERLGMRDRGYGWTVEMQARAARSGVRAVEVPVRYRRRIGRSKISGTVRGVLGAGTKILLTIARVRLGG